MTCPCDLQRLEAKWINEMNEPCLCQGESNYTDKEVSEAEVIFAAERLRGNVSMFSESDAAVEAALRRVVKVEKEGQRPVAVFSSITVRFVPILSRVLSEIGLTVRYSTEEVFYSLTLDRHSIDESKLKEFSSEGIERLNANDIPLVVSHWKYAKNQIADKYVGYILENHPQACIRNDKGELEAWVLVHMDWNLGILHTVDAARKRGHAKRLVAHVAKELAKKEFTPLAYAANDNAPSLAVFSSLGFDMVSDVEVCWIIATY